MIPIIEEIFEKECFEYITTGTHKKIYLYFFSSTKDGNKYSKILIPYWSVPRNRNSLILYINK